MALISVIQIWGMWGLGRRIQLKGWKLMVMLLYVQDHFLEFLWAVAAEIILVSLLAAHTLTTVYSIKKVQTTLSPYLLTEEEHRPQF